MNLLDKYFKYRGLSGALLFISSISTFNQPWNIKLGFMFWFLSICIRVFSRRCIGIHTRYDYITANTLVTHGPYSMSKNPLYISNLLFIACILMGQTYWLIVVWMIISFLHFHVLALAEAKYLQKAFIAYDNWKVPFWIGKFSYTPAEQQTKISISILEDKWTWIWQILMIVVLFFSLVNNA